MTFFSSFQLDSLYKSAFNHQKPLIRKFAVIIKEIFFSDYLRGFEANLN